MELGEHRELLRNRPKGREQSMEVATAISGEIEEQFRAISEQLGESSWV